MDLGEMVNRLLRFEEPALRDLALLCGTEKESCVTVVWAFLKHVGGNGDHVVSGFCDQALILLQHAMRQEAAEQLILTQWGEIPDYARIQLCYFGVHNPVALSTHLAMELFNSPSSGVADRHTIAAGLVATRSERHLDAESLVGLLDRIGRYADSRKQTILDRFITRTMSELLPE